MPINWYAKCQRRKVDRLFDRQPNTRSSENGADAPFPARHFRHFQLIHISHFRRCFCFCFCGPLRLGIRASPCGRAPPRLRRAAARSSLRPPGSLRRFAPPPPPIAFKFSTRTEFLPLPRASVQEVTDAAASSSAEGESTRRRVRRLRRRKMRRGREGRGGRPRRPSGCVRTRDGRDFCPSRTHPTFRRSGQGRVGTAEPVAAGRRRSRRTRCRFPLRPPSVRVCFIRASVWPLCGHLVAQWTHR